MTWIKSNEMPDYDGYYLCYIKRKNECGTVSEYQDVVVCRFNEWQIDENEKVTHWQPLPDMPKQKKSFQN